MADDRAVRDGTGQMLLLPGGGECDGDVRGRAGATRTAPPSSRRFVAFRDVK